MGRWGIRILGILMVLVLLLVLLNLQKQLVELQNRRATPGQTR